MDAAWTPNDFLLTLAMWSVMMIVMMTPTAIPVMLLFTRTRAGKAVRPSRGPGILFGLGHIAVWIGFSLLATVLQWALHRTALLSPDMAVSSPRVAAIILVAAGIYQLTPAKAKCLTKCQSPLGFLLGNWREGAAGALEMGVRYGTYCLGCCWALMCVLFVVGVMNLAWVAVLTGFVFLEKFGPSGVRLARAGGGVMILAGFLSFVT